MILPGHLSGGYLSALTVLSLSSASLSTTEQALCLIVGVISAELPDLDIIYYSWKHGVLKSKVDDDHRNYVTHAPFLWAVPLLSGILVAHTADATLTQMVLWSVLAGVMSHLVLDSIDHGIMWLWPLLKKRFCIFENKKDSVPPEKRGTILYYWRFITREYPKRASFYLEVILTLITIRILLP